MTDIMITKHAVERYKMRVKNTSDEVAMRDLARIATKGKVVYRRLNATNLMELEEIIDCDGVEILTVRNLENKSRCVITCYGGTELRKWYKKEKMQEIRKIAI